MNLSADVQWTFQERVNAVEQATRFQDRPVDVLSDVEETTDGLRTQVGARAWERCAGGVQREWSEGGALGLGPGKKKSSHVPHPARVGLLVCFAQLSRIPSWPADSVCSRVSRGGGHRRAPGEAGCVREGRWAEPRPGEQPLAALLRGQLTPPTHTHQARGFLKVEDRAAPVAVSWWDGAT